MKMKANAVKYGKRSLIWLLIAVMLMGTFAACDPGELPEDTSADEATTTEPTETDPVETDPVETDPVETEGSHSLSAVAATEATCTEDGNIAYWTCSHCEKLFGDAEGTTEVTVESIVVPAKGHTEVIDEAVAPTYENTGLTEGKHCSVCDTVLVKQEVLDKLETEEYAIIYRDYMDADIPEDAWVYNSATGVRQLPTDLQVAGYQFVGWSDKKQVKVYENKDAVPEDLVIKDYISKGTTGDVNLYAHWYYINYDIDYTASGVHSNPITYTVADTINLKAPEWTGLVFSHWSDQEGNVVTKINKGSIGNIVLNANWIREENITVSRCDHISTTWDDDLKRFYFIYDVGQISNVVLEEIDSIQKKAGQENGWSDQKTVTFEKSLADTVAITVAESVTESKEWSKTLENLDIDITTLEMGLKMGVSVPLAVETKAEIAAEIGMSGTHQDSRTDTTQQGGGSSNTSSSEETISSTVSYTNNHSSTFTRNTILSKEMPAGTYEYVCLGKVRVYAIVIYDLNQDQFYLNTYSVLEDAISHGTLYTPSEGTEVNIINSEALDFNIPTGSINAYLDSAHFIQYNLNNGVLIEGENYSTVYTSGDRVSIPDLEYSIYPEYIGFEGWYLDSDCETPFVNDLQTNPRDVTLYAKWEPFACYTSIDSTPGIVSGSKVIIDWSQENNTNLLTHTNRNVTSANYNQIIISDTVEEIVFIGEPTKLYANLSIILDSFANDQHLTIHFNNFSYVTNEETAIGVRNCETMQLAVDVIGLSAIKTVCPGGDIVDLGTSHLEMKGTGQLSILAGNGATGGTGLAGGTGGTGIIANSITVTENVSCMITGGSGGTGGVGAPGTNATTTYYYKGYYVYRSDWDGDTAHDGYEYRGSNGGEGGTGGNGGTGGMAVRATSFTTYSTGTITITGGDGGHGGVGGTGGRGANGEVGNGAAEERCDVKNGGTGGNGGQGGRGGDGGFASKAITCTIQSYNETATITILEGQRGNGGRGGQGGQGGNGGSGGTYRGTQGFANLGWGKQSATANGGNRGYGGSGGEGGIGLVSGIQGSTGYSGQVGHAGVNIWTTKDDEVKVTYYGYDGV